MIQVGNKYTNKQDQQVEIVFTRRNTYYGLNLTTQLVSRYDAQGRAIDGESNLNKEKYYLEMYKNGDGEMQVMVHETKLKAERSRDRHTIRIIEVEL